MAMNTESTQTMLYRDLGQAYLSMGLDKGYIKGCSNQNEEVLKGSWVFANRANGLRMHYGTFQSMNDLTVSFELPPGMSFTIVFDGSLNFAIGPYQYTLGEKINPVECSGFSVSQPEIVTRQISKNDYVRKLNLFAEREWLENYCSCKEDYQRLNRAFQEHARAKFWRPSIQLMHAANHVMRLKSNGDLFSSFEQEASALTLLSLMLKDLLKRTDTQQTIEENRQTKNNQADPIINYIDRSHSQLVTLDGLAKKFNISVSTLQRRFKIKHGVTVIDYIRNSKLDEAKRLLVEENLSTGEIAYLAGYKHPSNFLAAFKKRYSISPGEYRRKHSNVFFRNTN